MVLGYRVALYYRVGWLCCVVLFGIGICVSLYEHLFLGTFFQPLVIHGLSVISENKRYIKVPKSAKICGKGGKVWGKIGVKHGNFIAKFSFLYLKKLHFRFRFPLELEREI